RAIGVLHLLGKAAFGFLEFAGGLTHLAQLFVELAGGAAAELVAECFEFALGAGAFGQRLGDTALLERIGRPADVFAAFVQALLRFGHRLLILGLIHPFAQLITIAQHLLLFFP